MTEIAGLARAMHKTLPPIKCLKEWWFTQNWQFMAFISFWTCMNCFPLWNAKQDILHYYMEVSIRVEC